MKNSYEPSSICMTRPRPAYTPLSLSLPLPLSPPILPPFFFLFTRRLTRRYTNIREPLGSRERREKRSVSKVSGKSNPTRPHTSRSPSAADTRARFSTHIVSPLHSSKISIIDLYENLLFLSFFPSRAHPRTRFLLYRSSLRNDIYNI